jgi:zinc-ribbon domain
MSQKLASTHRSSLITLFMEPEIARRCPDCGASVRGNASFCPQCGRPVRAGAASVNSNVAETPEMPARRINDPGQNAPTIERMEGAPAPAADVAPARQSLAPGAANENQPRAEVVAPRASPDEDGRSKRQRVTAAARDVVEERLSPRVEKLRHASNVMLEEAAYDPSLRFVLVAIVILLLSLLLLLLNYFLG